MRPPLKPGTVIIHDPVAQEWLLFSQPVRTLTARTPDEVLSLLAEVEDAVERHDLFAAGCLAFEAALAFDPALRTRDPEGFPCAWFSLYKAPKPMRLKIGAAPCQRVSWRFPISNANYFSKIDRIKSHIRAGETYQVNFSIRLRAPFAGDPLRLFLDMTSSQGSHYAAYMDLGQWCVCSASPELFFRLDRTHLISRPMKGTAARGLWSARDKEAARELHASEKNRAENIMIVDMVRNDMGRVAKPGTVRADQLFALEQYPTIWQMTSTVHCETAAPVTEILRALFPAASITGAPKIRTTQLIAELEESPRRIYTGAIGFVRPGRIVQFNVAIRTALVDRVSNCAEYGVGGGIVWDSTPAEELEECRTKMAILRAPRPEFDLLETILWEPRTGYFLLEKHLERLADSANYFSWTIDVSEIRARLQALEKELPGKPQRVRLTLNRNGKITFAHRSFRSSRQPQRVALATHPISSSDTLLYHKTTRRELYEQARAASPTYDDVLLWNEKGEVTESTIANLAIKKKGRLFTPPVCCGLLPGVYRAWLLGRGILEEGIIRKRDLERCSQLYFMNSVRGLWQVTL